MTETEKTTKFEEILGNTVAMEAMGAASSAEEIQQIFADNGLEVSLDEAKNFTNFMDGKDISELDEDMLDSVAGGGKIKDFIVGKLLSTAYDILVKSAKSAYETGKMLANSKKGK